MRSSTQLLSAAWRTVADSPKIFVTISIITSLIITVLLFALGIDPEELESKEMPSGIDLVVTIVSAIIGIVANIALIKAVSDAKNATVSSVFEFAGKRFLSYVWVSMLQGLVVVVGIILLIVPGIYFAVALSFAAMVVLFEEARGIDALKVSYRYVKGRWFGVLGRYAFLTLIAILVIIPFSFISAGLDHSYLGTFVITALGFLASAISFSYSYEMYQDVRAPREVTPITTPINEPTLAS